MSLVGSALRTVHYRQCEYTIVPTGSCLVGPRCKFPSESLNFPIRSQSHPFQQLNTNFHICIVFKTPARYTVKPPASPPDCSLKTSANHMQIDAFPSPNERRLMNPSVFNPSWHTRIPTGACHPRPQSRPRRREMRNLWGLNVAKCRQTSFNPLPFVAIMAGNKHILGLVQPAQPKIPRFPDCLSIQPGQNPNALTAARIVSALLLSPASSAAFNGTGSVTSTPRRFTMHGTDRQTSLIP